MAIASGANYLFTHDRGYLTDGLAKHGVEVTRPDPFLAAAFESQPQAMLDLLQLQASLWAGGKPIAELLDALERAGAVTVAEMARSNLFGTPEP